MITNFKTYENKKEPQIGDWVIDYENEIGKIIPMFNKLPSSGKYRVQYYRKDELPYYDLRLRHIKHFGTKEEMETILTANKYNL